MEPLQSDIAAVGTNYWFVWPEGNWPPDWAWFLPRFFSSFCHRWSFGSLPLSPLACLVGESSFPEISPTWLHRYYLNWTELDNGHLSLSFYISDTLFSYFETGKLLWNNLYCWKRYINKGDLTWLQSSICYVYILNIFIYKYEYKYIHVNIKKIYLYICIVHNKYIQ